MSRVTPPVTRAIRQLAASNNGLLLSSTRSGYSFTQSNNSESADLLTGNDKIIRPYTTQTRPQAHTTTTTTCDKTIRTYNTTSRIRRASSTSAHHRPLMQGFSTSSVQSASSSTSPITLPSTTTVQASSVDNWHFPTLGPAPPMNPFERLRVPLLPDNYSPNRASEYQDVLVVGRDEEALPRIVAAYPEVVSAMSEVVGDESREVGLADLTRMVGDGERQVRGQEVGTLRSLWNDVLDDVLGQKGGAKLAH